jgi:Fuc2NAc and GlcNAc transferase
MQAVMTLSVLATLFLSGIAASWLLTSSMRRYALRADILDRPNERSSHSVPTPRGGGVAIVLSFLLLTGVSGLFGGVDGRLGTALAGGGALVALLGYIDDRSHLSARWRFLGHAAAAVWALVWIGPMPPVPMFGTSIDLGPAATVIAGVYVVWSINLFNFMDGIDGIASTEAICVSLGGALVGWLMQPSGSWPVAVLFAACVVGFLCWNFPPARIFMGDSGSGFLGLVVAVLALWSGRAAPELVWSWLVLCGCFMVDATVTLLRRVLRHERFYEAHRSHAYQYASRRHGSHQKVTLAVAAINVAWLLPIAVAVALRRIDGLAALLLAYAPLVALAIHYKAGDRKAQAEHA